MFKMQEGSISFPKQEQEIIRWWKESGIYEKSLEARKEAPGFVFFEGPPTANGLPHPGHCLTRAIKDLFPRYRTMRGYRCERKAGWDTHGLPVEVEVCKELGIHSKEEIEAYGVEPFIHLCRESVFRYMQQWEHLTERLGFWIHLDKAYVTYHQSYVESVWWALKNLFEHGLLYQGHKIVWWWAQGGTALSSGEVGQGYREVADPSVFVRFPLIQDQTFPADSLINADLLVWTTTPWTLPSNQFVAVKPDLDYVLVLYAHQERPVVVASALVDVIAAKLGGKKSSEYEILSEFKGEQLLGLRYIPPFPETYYDKDGQKTGILKDGSSQHLSWRVIPAQFVTTDSGSGLVHQAPAFGEVDYDVLQTEKSRFREGDGPELICAVAPDGRFSDIFPAYLGRWVKEADKDLIRDLKNRDRLFLQEQCIHEYPFCWRAPDDPLIQYPRRSWFIRTTQFKDQMLENNHEINWLPEHIRDGRFGNFLESNVDWALSRERYWGTPLPVWVCEKTGYMEAIANYDELMEKPGVSGMEMWDSAKKVHPELPDDLKVHKPYIDAITYDSPTSERMPDGSIPRMRRVSEVIDCWFDSGSMPFAQWGYPHTEGSVEKFNSQFPADFISEAIDQTRGWFYSQLAISTLLFGKHGVTGAPVRYPHPFKNCIVLGLMLAEWWESPDGKQRFLAEEDARKACGAKFSKKIGKMSKSLRNYRSPQEIFDSHGADALRWYFYANQAPWNSIIYSEQAIRDSMPEFMLRLWNVFGFFGIYANIDGFTPETLLKGNVGQLTPEIISHGVAYRPINERNELDRWIMSELNDTISVVTEKMDSYDNYPATGKITSFIDALSNWYVRRSRDRFWSSEHNQEKMDAYWTLYECLVTTAKIVAPFIPFMAENIWKTLVREPFAERAVESVHLCDYPTADSSCINPVMSENMELVREIVSLGRSARMGANLKVRQPLSGVDVILTDSALNHKEWLLQHTALVCDELNVKNVEYADRADEYITYSILPDLKKLGQKLRGQLPLLKAYLADADGGALLHQMETLGAVTITLSDGSVVTLSPDELIIRLEAKDGYAAAQGKNCVVVLSTDLTHNLVLEGYAREIVHAIQTQRKDMNCQYTDRIGVIMETESSELIDAVEFFADYIRGETLADILSTHDVDGFEKNSGTLVKLSGKEATFYIIKMK